MCVNVLDVLLCSMNKRTSVDIYILLLFNDINCSQSFLIQVPTCTYNEESYLNENIFLIEKIYLSWQGY